MGAFAELEGPAPTPPIIPPRPGLAERLREPARGGPAGDPRAAPGRPPRRAPRPRGRLAACPTLARPATARPPSARPTTRASAACRSRSCRRSSQKLAASGLGELEVREGDWRIRAPARGAGRGGDADAAERPRLGRPCRPRRRAARDGAGRAGSRAPAATGAADRGRRTHRHRRGRTDGALARGRRVPARGRGRDARPRRRPDRGRRPARHRPGRDVARSTGRSSSVFPQAGEAVEYGEEVAAVASEVEVEPTARAARPDAGSRRSRTDAPPTTRPATATGRPAHDQPRPDRQPRRDRAAHPAGLPDARHRGGRRLLRGRSRVAARDARRRGDLHRAGRRRAARTCRRPRSSPRRS